LGKWAASDPGAALTVFSTSKDQKEAAGAWSRGAGQKLAPKGIAIQDANLDGFLPN
jgi:hypothetical protein